MRAQMINHKIVSNHNIMQKSGLLFLVQKYSPVIFPLFQIIANTQLCIHELNNYVRNYLFLAAKMKRNLDMQIMF